jgi:hypothetical protein
MSGWAPVSPITPSIGTVPGPDGIPTTVFTYRVPYPTAGVEQFIAIPAGTSAIYLAAENLNARIRTSYVLGGTAAGDQYVTTHLGNSYYRKDLELPAKTLYYSANKSGIVIEIEIWV